MAINKASNQTIPTDNVMAAVQQLLEHVNEQPSVSITYHTSDMKLIVHSDASFNSESKGRSRTGGTFYFGNKLETSYTATNGGIQATTTIIPVVVASASEAEYGDYFAMLS